MQKPQPDTYRAGSNFALHDTTRHDTTRHDERIAAMGATESQPPSSQSVSGLAGGAKIRLSPSRRGSDDVDWGLRGVRGRPPTEVDYVHMTSEKGSHGVLPTTDVPPNYARYATHVAVREVTPSFLAVASCLQDFVVLRYDARIHSWTCGTGTDHPHRLGAAEPETAPGGDTEP
jgi:hypothetical protein